MDLWTEDPRDNAGGLQLGFRGIWIGWVPKPGYEPETMVTIQPSTTTLSTAYLAAKADLEQSRQKTKFLEAWISDVEEGVLKEVAALRELREAAAIAYQHLNGNPNHSDSEEAQEALQKALRRSHEAGV